MVSNLHCLLFWNVFRHSNFCIFSSYLNCDALFLYSEGSEKRYLQYLCRHYTNSSLTCFYARFPGINWRFFNYSHTTLSVNVDRGQSATMSFDNSVAIAFVITSEVLMYGTLPLHARWGNYTAQKPEISENKKESGEIVSVLSLYYRYWAWNTSIYSTCIVCFEMKIQNAKITTNVLMYIRGAADACVYIFCKQPLRFSNLNNLIIICFYDTRGSRH